MARSTEAPLFDQVQERKANFMSGPEFTNKVITLWYRPPEILLGAVQYGAAVDVWSAGCILAELVLGKPLFAAKTELDQLTMILEMLGPPPSSETYDFFESGMKKDTSKVPLTLSRSDKPPGKLRPKYAQKMPPAALGLLEKMLAWDPRQRVTAANVLNHRYFWTEPVAPENPAELGETLTVGGPDGHFHEFQTKKKRKQAKAIADEAKEKARLEGKTEEEAQAVYEKLYRQLMKKVVDEGLGANNPSAPGGSQLTPSDRPLVQDDDDHGRKGDRGGESRRQSSERSDSVGKDEESRRRDRRRSREGGESRSRRDSESSKKRRRDEPDESRRSRRRSRERRTRDDDSEARRRDEPREGDTGTGLPRQADNDRHARGRDDLPEDMLGRKNVPSDAVNGALALERDTRRDRDADRTRGADFTRDRQGRVRPPVPEASRDPVPYDGPERHRDRPPFEDSGYRRDRSGYDDRGRFREFGDRERPRPSGDESFRDRNRPPFDGRRPPEGRIGEHLPDRPFFDDRRPPFDDRVVRDRPPDRPAFDSGDSRGRNRQGDRPPFDNRGGPPDGRERDRPPGMHLSDDRGPRDGRGRLVDGRGPRDGRGRRVDGCGPLDGRGRERPPFDDRGAQEGRERDRLMDRPLGGDRGLPRDGPGPPFDDRDRPRGRPPFDSRERQRDGPPFERQRPRETQPTDDRRQTRDWGPDGELNAPGGDIGQDDRERQRMGPSSDREKGFVDERDRPGNLPPLAGGRIVARDRPLSQFDDLDGSRRQLRENRGMYGPSRFDDRDQQRREYNGRPDGDVDNEFPDEPGRIPNTEGPSERLDAGSRRDRSDRRGGDNRRRKKEKKRRDRSRSRDRDRSGAPRRKDRRRDDRRRNDGNPDYYGPPHGQEGDRRREDRDRHDDSRERDDRHRDRDRGHH